MQELLGLANRILVMAGGRITAHLQGEAMTEDAILRAAMPGAPAPGPGAPSKDERRAS